MAVHIYTDLDTKLLLFISLTIILTSCSNSTVENDTNNIVLDSDKDSEIGRNEDTTIKFNDDYDRYMLAPDEEIDDREDSQRIEISEGKVALVEIDRKRFVLNFLESASEKSAKMEINYEPEILKLNKAIEVDGYEFILRKLDTDVATVFSGRDIVKFYLITREGLFTEVLEENQYKKLARGDSEYDIEATYISEFYSRPSVKFKIDGEETEYLEEDENQNLKNGNMIYVGEIYLAETKVSVVRDLVEIGIRKAIEDDE